MDSITQDKFRIIKKISSGSFGQVFQARIIGSSINLAVKFEKPSSSNRHLSKEFTILKSLQGIKGIPNVFSFGSDSSSDWLALELLDRSLEDFLNLSNRKMSLKTVLMLAGQLLTTLEGIHSKNIVHRDIKPQNVLMGRSSVYLVDFGLSKEFKNQSGYFQPNFNETPVGTPTFMSISAHIGISQSCRDDLESLSYLLIYLQLGHLPWQNSSGSKGSKNDQILKIKSTISLETLCEDLEDEFKFFVEYARSLKYDEVPNYELIRRNFSALFRKKRFLFDSVYDWTRVSRRKDSLTQEEFLV